MNKSRALALISIIVLAALARFIPHPPNFTPVAAIALFGGAQFSKKYTAFFVVFAAMLLSDAFLGFHSTIAFVYISLGIAVMFGWWLRSGEQKLGRIVSVSLLSSATFFVVTNFGYWTVQSLYPKTAAGLAACYTAAIPFFSWTVIGDLFYVGILFGGLALASQKFEALREEAV